MANEDDTPSVETTPPTDESTDTLPSEEISASPAALFGVLADDRSRYALYHLVESDGPVPINVMAAKIADQERGIAESATVDANRRVHTSLYHVKLPKLEDYGFVEYDLVEGEVEATDRAAELAPYLQVAERLEDDEFTDRS